MGLAAEQVRSAGRVVVEELAKEHGTKLPVGGPCTKSRFPM
jgi:hypothetical protein